MGESTCIYKHSAVEKEGQKPGMCLLSVILEEGRRRKRGKNDHRRGWEIRESTFIRGIKAFNKEKDRLPPPSKSPSQNSKWSPFGTLRMCYLEREHTGLSSKVRSRDTGVQQRKTKYLWNTFYGKERTHFMLKREVKNETKEAWG